MNPIEKAAMKKLLLTILDADEIMDLGDGDITVKPKGTQAEADAKMKKVQELLSKNFGGKF